MTGTHIEFDNDDQHFDLKGKANLLRIDLRELMIKGALAYKPKKGDIQGMEMFMEKDDTPTDVFNLKQWKKYGKNHEQELKKFILGLDKIYQELKK